MTVSRLYSWHIPSPPNGAERKLYDAMVTESEKARTYDKRVTECSVQLLEGEGVVVTLEIQGHDQWWIKKRAPSIISALLSRAKVPQRVVALVAVERPEDERRTRLRASDGRHNRIPEDVLILHEELSHA